ncbi:MAG: LysR family transcriptional regulator [Tenericutes bacterium]|nr:LysR family transcriptional regulator [Mycoplasmatota bacterium]
MNIMHLRYAIEIEKTKSINKAAENLFMSQPNLSRAIKELEKSLGIIIFNRTSKGMSLTVKGSEFLIYAKKILREIDEVQKIYSDASENKQSFSISVPRSSYISHAFSEFVKNLDLEKKAEIYYKETNSLKAIRNILQSDYKLGIIRYQDIYDDYFKSMLEDKGFKSELISEFSYIVLLSKEHPLASKECLTKEDLEKYIEIAHSDPYVPTLSMNEIKKEELPDNINRRIYVFERASQFNLLNKVHTTYLWGTPIPDELLEMYNLVYKRCVCQSKVYKDVLISRKDYKFSELDLKFITEITKAKRNILHKKR